MLNKVLLIGRMTRDPDLKFTPSNVAVVAFTLAVERKYAKPGEERKADFINCVAWRGAAEFIAKHFTKGQMINVVGALQVREWVATDGSKRYATEVIVDEVNFCGEKKDPLNNVVNAIGGTQYPPQGFTPMQPIDEDVPF